MIMDYINNDWRTKADILNSLNKDGITMDERTFRKRVENQNKLYIEHLSPYFIAHSSKGYKKTTNREEIVLSVKDNRKRALNMLMKESKTLKTLGENENMTLFVRDGEISFTCDNGL